MKSNSFFSFNRFGLLLKNDLLLNYKQYLLTIVAAFIVGYFVVYSHLPWKEYFEDYIIQKFYHAFIYCLMGFGAFIGLSFPGLNSKTASQNYLMMPGSTFEKYLSQFFIRIVLASVLFLVIFWVDAYLARITVLQSDKFVGLATDYESFSYSALFKFMMRTSSEILGYASLIVMVSIGLYMFTVRLFFTKLAIFKTVISLVGFIFLVAFVFVLFSHAFYPETTIGFQMNIREYHVYENITNMEMWIAFVFSIPWIFLLPLGYFKLKEKQL